MVARRFNESDVDFEAIDGDLAKLAPPKLTLKTSWTVCETAWSSNGQGRHGGADTRGADGTGIEIGERSLKAFLDKGELPGRKTVKSVAGATASAEGRDPF